MGFIGFTGFEVILSGDQVGTDARTTFLDRTTDQRHAGPLYF
jgi:hypothetical protein